MNTKWKAGPFQKQQTLFVDGKQTPFFVDTGTRATATLYGAGMGAEIGPGRRIAGVLGVWRDAKTAKLSAEWKAEHEPWKETAPVGKLKTREGAKGTP